MEEKYIRPTETERGHTNVFIRGKYVGYMIGGTKFFEYNWYFINEMPILTNDGIRKDVNATNRKNLVEKIKEKFYVND
jgi:hypothetical protein